MAVRAPGQLDLIPSPEKKLPMVRCDWPKNYVEEFWKRYPRRLAKAHAVKMLDRVRERGDVKWQTLIEAVEWYAVWAHMRGEIQFVKHPGTWLNRGCWDDEITIAEFENGQGRSRAFQDDSRSLSKAADRLIDASSRGELQFAPRPSLLPPASKTSVQLLPKR